VKPVNNIQSEAAPTIRDSAATTYSQRPGLIRGLDLAYRMDLTSR
jgi:hypothetical protein